MEGGGLCLEWEGLCLGCRSLGQADPREESRAVGKFSLLRDGRRGRSRLSSERGNGRYDMPTAIQISQLRKHYGATVALDGIDLEIPAGQFFGLLGPNGAGKTTLISNIVGLVRPSGGWVR